MIDIGRRVGAQNGIAPFVADGAQYEGLVVQYLEYFWDLGGEVSDRDGQSVLFPLDKAERAAEFMRVAFREGVYAPGFDTMKQEDSRKAFQEGDAVFLRSWPYAYQPMNRSDPDSQVVGKVGIASLPGFRGHRPVATPGGHNLAMNAFSRNIRAATEFVRFVSTSREVQRGLAQQHSLVPTLKAAYQDLAADPMMALLPKLLPLGWSDRGCRRHRNEDALALRGIGSSRNNAALAIVCDGVSSSARPDEAAGDPFESPRRLYVSETVIEASVMCVCPLVG